MPNLKKFLCYVLLPAVSPAVFFLLALGPVRMMSFRGQGLLVLSIAFMSMLASIGATSAAFRSRTRGDDTTAWWIGVSIILAIPAIALLIPV